MNKKLKPLIIFEEDICKLSCFDIKDNMYEISKSGYIFSNHTGNVMKPSISDNGYNLISLNTNNSGRKTFKKSRLVAKTFIENDDPNKNIVNHKNLDKLNDSYDNLEWCTSSENTLHSMKNGHGPYRGEKHAFARITNEQANQICELLEKGYRCRDIVNILSLPDKDGTMSDIVSNIANKKCWIHISCNYNIPIHNQIYLFTDEQVHSICKLLELHTKTKNILDILSLENTKSNKKGIEHIRRRMTYRHISKNYDW